MPKKLNIKKNNKEKYFFEAIRLIKLATCPSLETGYNCLLGKRTIINHQLYHLGEKMFIEAQEEMGRENKNRIRKECKDRGIAIPNFKEQCI